MPNSDAKQPGETTQECNPSTQEAAFVTFLLPVTKATY